MPGKASNRNTSSLMKKAIAAVSFGALFAAVPALAQDFPGERDRFFFWPGNLVVSRSVYDNHANNVKLGEIVPPNCANTTGGCSAATGAPYNGTYPFVWNNDMRTRSGAARHRDFYFAGGSLVDCSPGIARLHSSIFRVLIANVSASGPSLP